MRSAIARRERSRVSRLRVDIKDLRLAGAAEAAGRRVVATGKHLCGAAADLALRCLLLPSRSDEDANADADQFPATWLFHHRWAKMTTGSIASPIGRIHFDTIGGRTTAFLPDVQKKTGGKPAAKPSAKPASKKKRVSAAKKPSAAKKRRTSPRNLSK